MEKWIWNYNATIAINKAHIETMYINDFKVYCDTVTGKYICIKECKTHLEAQHTIALIVGDISGK